MMNHSSLLARRSFSNCSCEPVCSGSRRSRAFLRLPELPLKLRMPLRIRRARLTCLISKRQRTGRCFRPLAYMASGVDDDATLRANREIFKHVQLRPRRLRDATLVNTHVELFGTTYNSPIFLCPTGGERGFYMDGELSVARAPAHGHVAVPIHDDVHAYRRCEQGLGPPCWYQLYAPSKWKRVRNCYGASGGGSTVVLLLWIARLAATAKPINEHGRTISANAGSCHLGPASLPVRSASAQCSKVSI